MGILKRICDHLEVISDRVRVARDLCADGVDKINRIALKVDRIRDETIVMSAALEDMKELPIAPCRSTLEVKPVETTDGKTMFLVTGEQLSDLLMACRSATLQMKEREAHVDE